MRYAGAVAADAVDAISFANYERELAEGLDRALGAVTDNSNAVYLRIRPDLRWDGEFHVTTDTHVTGPFAPHEEYSHSGPIHECAGPALPEAAEARRTLRTDDPLDPSGTEHYLLARTVAAFGRCVARRNPPIAVFFSCMYAVFRMSEPM